MELHQRQPRDERAGRKDGTEMEIVAGIASIVGAGIVIASIRRYL